MGMAVAVQGGEQGEGLGLPRLELARRQLNPHCHPVAGRVGKVAHSRRKSVRRGGGGVGGTAGAGSGGGGGVGDAAEVVEVEKVTG